MSTVPIQPVTDAVFDALVGAQAADPDNSPHVYDADSAPDGRSFPYVVLYQVAGGGSSGPPLTAPDADAEIVFQLDGVGQIRGSAQWARDWACNVLIGRNPDGSFKVALDLPADLAVCDRLLDETMSGVDREGTPPNATFTAAQRVRVAITHG